MHFSEDNSLPTLTFFLQTLTSLHISRLYWHTLLYTYFFLPKQISLQRHYPSSANFFIQTLLLHEYTDLYVYTKISFLHNFCTQTSPYPLTHLHTNTNFSTQILSSFINFSGQTFSYMCRLLYANLPFSTQTSLHRPFTIYTNFSTETFSYPQSFPYMQKSLIVFNKTFLQRSLPTYTKLLFT